MAKQRDLSEESLGRATAETRAMDETIAHARGMWLANYYGKDKASMSGAFTAGAELVRNKHNTDSGRLGAQNATLRARIAELEAALAEAQSGTQRKKHAAMRGTAEHPCKYCGNTETGNTLMEGWYRCNKCGEPSK